MFNTIKAKYLAATAALPALLASGYALAETGPVESLAGEAVTILSEDFTPGIIAMGTGLLGVVAVIAGIYLVFRLLRSGAR